MPADWTQTAVAAVKLENELALLKVQARLIAAKIDDNPGARDLGTLSKELREVWARLEAVKQKKQTEGKRGGVDELAARRASRTASNPKNDLPPAA